jgi:transcription termination/antitermination protein NusA
MEDLAAQSVDELVDIAELNHQQAGRLIMTARAPWFESQDGV